jgi:hypothetical protein
LVQFAQASQALSAFTKSQAEALVIDAAVGVTLFLVRHGALEPRLRLGELAGTRQADAQLVQA